MKSTIRPHPLLPAACLALFGFGAPALHAQVNNAAPWILCESSAGAVTDTNYTNADVRYDTTGGTSTSSSISGNGKPSTGNQQITDPGQYQFYDSASVADGVNPVTSNPYGVSTTCHVSMPTGSMQFGVTTRGGGGSARGTIVETITFHNPSTQSVVMDVKLALPGTVSRTQSDSNSGSSWQGFVKFTGGRYDAPDGSYAGNVGAFYLDYDGNGSRQSNTFQTSGYSPTDIDLPANGVGGSVTMHISLLPGDTDFNFQADITVRASSSNAAAGAGLSPVLSFGLPAGVSYTSLSGTLLAHPAFSAGEVPLTNGVYYLSFASGNPFGYYSYLTDPHYIYHFDLGYEYLFPAGGDSNGLYLYDFTSGSYFYTSPTFPFPYLYDFSLGSTLYYYPDPNNPGRYNTNGVRYFYEFKTGQIISK